jgi:uncharacterized protein
MIAFSEKALCLFSLLFGVGLAIQFERLAQNARRLALLLRRLAVLMGIGLVHLFLIWDGDILVEYALAGFVVLPLLFTSQRTLLAVSVIFLGAYCIVPYLPGIPQFPSQSWIMQHIAEARQAYGAGGFADVQAFRIHEIPAILGLHIRVFPRTVALFLFGAFAWRTGILREARPHRRFLFGLAVTALFVGAGLTALALEWTYIVPPALRGLRSAMQRTTPILLAIGYGAVVIAAFAGGAEKLFVWAAPLGRTAFTNYLIQSIVLGWIFYGYGLGLFGSVGIATACAMGVLIYVLQVIGSIWWLKYFRFGPVEWLWRTLMYGTVQPMRLRPSTPT